MTRVAFQGEYGAFGEEAAVLLWGAGATPVPCRTFADVVRAVESGETEAGVLPVENRIAGAVLESLGALREATAVEITSTAELPIRLHLLGLEGALLGGLTRIASHPVALAQCRAFLKTHPWAEPVPWYDTAGAARDVARAADPSFAAGASLAAAERYGLSILALDIQDREDNMTRFVAIRRRP